jgi:hypothetical protein
MDNEKPMLIERLHNEADQCRNDGADDIVNLLGDCICEIRRLRAEAETSERLTIMFGDLLHHQILAMRAAVVDASLRGAEIGMDWIVNTLEGPGHLPDVAAARELGGAQALFDAEMAVHEAFRAAHPAP